VSNSLGSWFFAISSAFSLFGSWASMHTLKTIDRIQNLYVGLLLLGVGLFGLGASQNFYILLLASACAGLGFGFLGVSANILATVGCNSHHRQKIVSGLHSMYGLSSLLAPLAVNLIYSLGGKWRETFNGAGVLCLLLFFGAVIFVKKENLDLTKRAQEGKDGKSKLSEITFKPALLLSFMVSLYVVAEILISSRLALYLRLHKSYDLIHSGYYVTGFFVCLFAGRLLFSFIQPKVNMSTQLLSALTLSFVSMVLGIQLHESFLMLTGFFMGPFYPLAMTYVSKKFPDSVDSALALVISLQSFFLVLMHLSSGLITDTFGVVGAMSMGPVVLVVSSFLLIGFEKWKPV
jgi:fucose permease